MTTEELNPNQQAMKEFEVKTVEEITSAIKELVEAHSFYELACNGYKHGATFIAESYYAPLLNAYTAQQKELAEARDIVEQFAELSPQIQTQLQENIDTLETVKKLFEHLLKNGHLSESDRCLIKQFISATYE